MRFCGCVSLFRALWGIVVGEKGGACTRHAGYCSPWAMIMIMLMLMLILMLYCMQFLCSIVFSSLWLVHCTIQLGALGSQPGVLQGGCTALTRLDLVGCVAIDGRGGLQGLALLSNLRSLRIDQCHYELLIRGSVLPSLMHLTHLGLEPVDGVGLHHLSCLSKLCELNLRLSKPRLLTPSIRPAWTSFHLPASLWGLWLTSNAVLDASLLHNLTGLQVLEVQGLRA